MSSEVQKVDESALAAAATQDLDLSDMVVPMLKVGQALTAEVSEGDAEVGDLIHSLTGETFDAVDVIVLDAFKGRQLKVQETNQLFNVYKGQSVVPEHWPIDGAGTTHFVDHPDAEEQYRERANSGEIEWGSGPRIATTYNFVVLLVRDGEPEQFPVRLSLSRSTAKVGKQWQTMVKIARTPWDFTYTVSTFKTTNKKNQPFAGVKVKQSGKTSPEQRQFILPIAQALLGADVSFEDDTHEAEPAAPADGMDL